MKNLLLISNSTLHGSGYLDHCENEIKTFLPAGANVLFVPFARPGGISWDEYSDKAGEKFEDMGFKLRGVHEFDDRVKAAENAEAFFIGGGNTFVLVDELYNSGLIEPIRKRVAEGAPYIGTSAGSNVACPTMMTTNDMPIREIKSFETLNLVPFQINPHYLDPDPDSTHKGETRETRIREYLAFNDRIVVGLREGCVIRVEGAKATLKGATGARVFRQNAEPEEFSPVCDMSFIME